jgi:hypothetical protein
MDEDYAIGISILVLLGSMFTCCSTYFLYAIYIKKGSQEALLPEGAPEDSV